MKKSVLFVLVCLLGASSVFAQASFVKPSATVPENKDEMIGKAESFMNAGFTGDMESMKAMMHEAYYQFPPGAGQDSLSKEKSLEDWAGFSKEWKDATWNGISTCIKTEQGAHVVFLWGKATGTQISSGKSIEFMNHGVFVFEGDKIIRMYSYYDTATIGKQLGFKMVPDTE
ncbi:MAG: nuclear transport factor 2 family protein [Bacteroidia bacterium]|nr:nuclear transport factor 2 family protein [Bacteroidia bacterium]